MRALVVPFAFKNTAPAVKSAPQGIVLVTRDGTSHHGWPYNEKLWNQHHGRSVYWELGQVRPDVWIQTALVFDVDPDEVEGAVLYLARIGYVRDLRGSSHRVVYEHAVAELAAPTSGPPIRGLPRR